MITELTQEQEELLKTYKDKWTEIGLSTKEVDIEKAMEAVKAAYIAGGLEAPEKYEIYDSPFEARDEMKLRYNIDIKSADFAYGAHDASWLSFYNYFLEVLKIDTCKPLQGLMDLAKYTGWWLPFDELIVFTHNPVHIKFDEEGQTHCEDDLAIKYRDGTGVAMWHGTAIPEAWIFDKSSITPEVMFKWPNIEERRCACEIIGWVNVLKELDAVVIDKDPEKTIGTLLEVELPDSGKERFLLVSDPNVNKLVGLPVPPEMKTALEANSWTYGIDKVNFKPEFRV